MLLLPVCFSSNNSTSTLLLALPPYNPVCSSPALQSNNLPSHAQSPRFPALPRHPHPPPPYSLSPSGRVQPFVLLTSDIPPLLLLLLVPSIIVPIIATTSSSSSSFSSLHIHITPSRSDRTLSRPLSTPQAHPSRRSRSLNSQTFPAYRNGRPLQRCPYC